MTEDIWKIVETSEVWKKKWQRFNNDGSIVGAQIIVVNGSVELIEALTKAFEETEGRKVR